MWYRQEGESFLKKKVIYFLGTDFYRFGILLFSSANNTFKSFEFSTRKLNTEFTETWKNPYLKTLYVICALNCTQNRNLSPACTLSVVSAFFVIYNQNSLQLLHHLPFFIMTASPALFANRGLILNGRNISLLEALTWL